MGKSTYGNIMYKMTELYGNIIYVYIYIYK